MSSDYEAVKKALASGTDPAMLCATCPWDRNCINPPQMTSGDIDQQIADAAAKDKEAAKTGPEAAGRMPFVTLMTTVILAGKDTAVQACPVLGIRLRSADGRRIAELVRSAMQSWEES